MRDMQALATKEQVADYLNVKPGTLDTWAKQKKGPPYFKVEGVRRYEWTEVEAWLNDRKVVNP